MVDHVKRLTEVNQYTPYITIGLHQGMYTINEINECTYSDMTLDRLANSYVPVCQSSTVGCPTESTFACTAYTILTIVISHSLISCSSVDRPQTSTCNLIRGRDDDNQQAVCTATHFN